MKNKGALSAIIGAALLAASKSAKKSKVGNRNNSDLELKSRPLMFLEKNRTTSASLGKWLGYFKGNFHKDEYKQIEFATSPYSQEQIFTGQDILQILETRIGIPQKIVFGVGEPKEDEIIDFAIDPSIKNAVFRAFPEDEAMRHRILSDENLKNFDQFVCTLSEEEQKLIEDIIFTEEGYQNLGISFNRDAYLRACQQVYLYFENSILWREGEDKSFEFNFVSRSPDVNLPEYAHLGRSNYGEYSLFPEEGEHFSVYVNIMEPSVFTAARDSGHFGTLNVFHFRGRILPNEDFILVEEIQSDRYQSHDWGAFLEKEAEWASAAVLIAIRIAKDIGINKVLFVDEYQAKQVQHHEKLKPGIERWYGKFIPKIVESIANTCPRLGTMVHEYDDEMFFGLEISGVTDDDLNRMTAYGFYEPPEYKVKKTIDWATLERTYPQFFVDGKLTVFPQTSARWKSIIRDHTSGSKNEPYEDLTGQDIGIVYNQYKDNPRYITYYRALNQFVGSNKDLLDIARPFSVENGAWIENFMDFYWEAWDKKLFPKPRLEGLLAEIRYDAGRMPSFIELVMFLGRGSISKYCQMDNKIDFSQWFYRYLDTDYLENAAWYLHHLGAFDDEDLYSIVLPITEVESDYDSYYGNIPKSSVFRKIGIGTGWNGTNFSKEAGSSLVVYDLEQRRTVVVALEEDASVISVGKRFL
jgi:hypothetical protein